MSDPNSDEAGIPPLTGVRVLDLTQVVAGPFACTLLADLGADVVKVERPDVGDEMRSIGRYEGRDEHEDYFYANNRNKRSITLDLKTDEDRSVARNLAAVADVVVENFAPGTAERLGMSWNDLRPLNPRLVYCSISGFGQDGPYRNRMAIDSVIQGISGLMSVTGFPDGDPVIVGAPLADIISGLFAGFAIMGGLYGVRTDGKGEYIDVAMQASMIAAIGPRMGEALQMLRSPSRIGNENPMRIPSDTYRTADGRYVNITVVNQRHWAPFCRAIDRPEWIDDPRFVQMPHRVQNRNLLKSMVTQRFAEHPLSHWLPKLERERVAHSPVNNYVEALDDPQIAHRGMIHEVQHPVSGAIKVIGRPWRTTRKSPAISPPPLLGQHTQEVLRSWLSYDDDRIATFMNRPTHASADAV